MKISLVDLAGHRYPGGCEKYFSNLAEYLSHKNEISFWESSQYKLFMDFVYFLLFQRDIHAVTLIKRDLKKTAIIDIPFSIFLPFSKLKRKLVAQLVLQERIYVKNEFQELLLTFFLLGKKAFQEKVIIGVHTPVFIPKKSKGMWEFFHALQYQSFLYKSFYKNAYKIHVVTNEYIELIHQNYKIPYKKIIHIQNPIDWKTFIAKNDTDTFKILWVGRLTTQKGLDRLGKILEKVLKKNKGIEIVIAGEGEKREIVANMALKHKQIIWKGFVKDLTQEYENTDLVIFTAYFDTFAHAVLEPQSYGIPVVSFDIAGPRDIIVNNKTGYLVKSTKSFANKILYYVDMKEKNVKKFNSIKIYTFTSINKRFNKAKIFTSLSALFQ